MKDTARIIVTTDCLRNCEYCCNTQALLESAEIIREVPLWYKNYVITGGEPTLYPERISRVIGERTFLSTVYLQTARWTKDLFDSHSLSGVTYSIHKEMSGFDLERFQWFQDWAEKIYLCMSLRLFIERGVKREIPVKPYLYQRITIQEHKQDCPLPCNEDLFILKY